MREGNTELGKEEDIYCQVELRAQKLSGGKTTGVRSSDCVWRPLVPAADLREALILRGYDDHLTATGTCTASLDPCS
jgi:hypothetical protein